MTTVTYYSPFFPPVEGTGVKGTTIAVVPSKDVEAIREDITGVKEQINQLEDGGFLDNEAPPRVVGLVLTSSTEIGANGAPVTTLKATWNKSTAPDVASYNLLIKENSGNFVLFSTGVDTSPGSTQSYTWTVRANQTFTVMVRAVDKSGNQGDYSETATIVSAKDTIPPAAPTVFDVALGFSTLYLTWTNAPDSDLANVKIFEADSSNFNTAVPIVTVNATPSSPGAYARSGLASGVAKYYWLQSIDTSGNVSPIVGPQSGRSVKLTDADVTPDLTVPRSVPTLNVNEYRGSSLVFNQADSKFYRWNGLKYVSNTAAADIIGTIVNDQITDGVITGAKIANSTINSGNIAANSITAKNLILSDYANLITTADFATVDANGQPDGWSRRIQNGGAVGVATAGPNDGWPQKYAIAMTRLTGNGELSITNGNVGLGDIGFGGGIAVKQGDEFYLECTTWSNGPVPIADVYHRSYNNTLTFIGRIQGPTTQAYTVTGGAIKNTAGEGRIFVRLVLELDGALGTAYFWNPRLTKRANANLIVDGAITTRTLDALAITSEKIASKAITAGKIDTDAITANNITAGAISAVKIAAGAITASKLGVIGEGMIADPFFIDNDSWRNVGSQSGERGNLGLGQGWYHHVDGNESAGNANFWTASPGAIFLNSNHAWVALNPNERFHMYLNNLDASKPITVKPGVEYNVSFVANNQSNQTINVNVFTQNPANGQVTGFGAVAPAGVTFNPYNFDFVPPPGQTSLVTVVVYNTGQQYGEPTFSGVAAVSRLQIREKYTGRLIVDGTIEGKHIVADTITGEKIRANTIDAGSIKSNTSLPGSLQVDNSGFLLGSIKDAAYNPAGRINSFTTQIAPGKIYINGEGGTTLADWRAGPDNTQINGGSIAANTITANKVTIGLRGIEVVGVKFEHDRNNTLFWSAGYVDWIDDSGNRVVSFVNGGSYTKNNSSTGITYVWFDRISSHNNQILYAGETSPAYIMQNSNNIILATYWGGTQLNANHGMTVIDGDSIKTGAIDATKISVGSLSALSANIGLLRTASSGQRMELDSNSIRSYDTNGVMRVRLGIW